MTILTEWNLILNADDILRGQGANPVVVRTGKPLLLAVAERARTEGLKLIHPVTLFQEVAVHKHLHERIILEGGAALTGKLVARQLGGAQRVVFAACTIGSELEEAVVHLLPQDPLYALALDGLGNASVEILAQQVCAYIAEQAQGEGWNASTPLSPGSLEWPVEVGQPQIFSLLNPSLAGIALTSGGMMVPKKSISFVLGLGIEMSQVEACDVCSLKETCRYQHA